ncbi:acyl carrier protein [Actinomadura sediminis]|uniref:Acyl carrier protein n=1 Tax=Actinomadura sediminis TaxID=1038904 RepID=A0ABW3EJE4_9ACTN
MAGQRITVDELQKILFQVAGEPDVAGAMDDGTEFTLEELGYDSIAVLAAMAEIERDTGVKVDDEKLATATTLSEIVTLINEE